MRMAITTSRAAATLPKAKYRQNQFGGSIGGPIRKDKTFFFGDFEALKIRQGIAINGGDSYCQTTHR